jgi:tetratricopeptide (TPR) repeat protein
VEWILEGTVAREADEIRITVQLIDAVADTHVWSGRFDRHVSSVLALRTDIARAVAAQLQLKLSSEGQSVQTVPRTVDEKAYDAYLRGLHHFGPISDNALWRLKALEELETAVALDPDFAEAWAKIAAVQFLAFTRPGYLRAREAAVKALSLDNRLGTAHAVLGYVALLYDWDNEAARVAFEQSVQLNPNDPSSLNGYIASLHFQERDAEVIPVARRLLRVAPMDTYFRPLQIKSFAYARFYVRAIQEAERIRELQPGYVDQDMVYSYVQLGRFEDAYRTLIAVYRRGGERFDGLRKAAEQGWQAGGFEGSWRARLEYWEASDDPVSASMAIGYGAVGEMDQAFAWLEQAVESRNANVPLMPWYHVFDPMRLDPRFDAMLERLKFQPLPESPARMADVGRVMAFRGRAPEAIPRLERAIAECPNDPRVWRWFDSMAWAHFAMGDHELTISWVKRVLACDLNAHAAAFAHLLLGSSHAHCNRADAAGKAMEEALKLWPTLDIDRDLQPLFLGGDGSMRDRYVKGLYKAGES